MSDEQVIQHYTNAQGLIGIIKSRQIWATESNYLDDPTEVSFASKVLISKLGDYLATRSYGPLELRPSGGPALRSISQTVALLNDAYADPHSRTQYREDRVFMMLTEPTSQRPRSWSVLSVARGRTQEPARVTLT